VRLQPGREALGPRRGLPERPLDDPLNPAPGARPMARAPPAVASPAGAR
jgi:hypothetical protein